MLIAVEYLQNVGVGVTMPQLFRANDGEIYVVKLRNNRLGTKVLASEFLGAKIGEVMGLCFPPSQVIEITKDTLQNSQFPDNAEADLGKHFASKYLSNTEYVTPQNLHQIANASEMAGIMLFDHIFHNSDRTSNRRNLLVRKENDEYRIYAIDNSHLFRSGRWTLASLRNLETKIKVYYHRSYGLLLRELLSSQDFAPYIEKFRTLQSNQIDTFVQQIPDEWLPEAIERQALASFVKARRDKLDEICEKLYKQIPKDRGGLRWLNGKIIRSRNKRNRTTYTTNNCLGN